MQLQILISIIIIIIMIIIISKYPIINVAYVGATTVPIAFPIIWWKNSSLKIKSLFFKTRFKVLRIKDLLNLEWINSVYLSTNIQLLSILIHAAYWCLKWLHRMLLVLSFLWSFYRIFWESQNHLLQNF